MADFHNVIKSGFYLGEVLDDLCPEYLGDFVKDTDNIGTLDILSLKKCFRVYYSKAWFTPAPTMNYVTSAYLREIGGPFRIEPIFLNSYSYQIQSGSTWEFFEVPKGVVLESARGYPKKLGITKDEFLERLDAYEFGPYKFSGGGVPYLFNEVGEKAVNQRIWGTDEIPDIADYVFKSEKQKAASRSKKLKTPTETLKSLNLFLKENNIAPYKKSAKGKYVSSVPSSNILLVSAKNNKSVQFYKPANVKLDSSCKYYTEGALKEFLGVNELSPTYEFDVIEVGGLGSKGTVEKSKIYGFPTNKFIELEEDIASELGVSVSKLRKHLSLVGRTVDVTTEGNWLLCGGSYYNRISELRTKFANLK